MTAHQFPVQIYYEDTDLSGAVYHANYLRYFERAREHLLGVDELLRLLDEDGIGFVVYKAELTFKEAARLGDRLMIRSTLEMQGRYRCLFHQSAWREDGSKELVEGLVQLACTDREGKLVPIPDSVQIRVDAETANRP